MTPVEPWKPLVLPLRNAAIYAAVIDSLQVESNPRYQPKDGKTFCNIFVWDVTRAMGCEVPHWVGGERRMVEQKANDMVDWLDAASRNLASDWQGCDAVHAQAQANAGCPTIACWKNTNGPGHIAMVRPNTGLAKGPIIAQAGTRNFSSGTLELGFGARPVEFFWHP